MLNEKEANRFIKDLYKNPKIKDKGFRKALELASEYYKKKR